LRRGTRAENPVGVYHFTLLNFDWFSGCEVTTSVQQWEEFYYYYSAKPELLAPRKTSMCCSRKRIVKIGTLAQEWQNWGLESARQGPTLMAIRELQEPEPQVRNRY